MQTVCSHGPSVSGGTGKTLASALRWTNLVSSCKYGHWSLLSQDFGNKSGLKKPTCACLRAARVEGARYQNAAVPTTRLRLLALKSQCVSHRAAHISPIPLVSAHDPPTNVPDLKQSQIVRLLQWMPMCLLIVWLTVELPTFHRFRRVPSPAAAPSVEARLSDPSHMAIQMHDRSEQPQWGAYNLHRPMSLQRFS